MTRRPVKRVVDSSGRQVGNIYQRLERARQQRAEVLATPKAANTAKPATSAPKPIKKTPVKVVPERVEAARKESLPQIKPVVVASAPAPKSVIVGEPAPEPEPKRKWVFWCFALVAGLAATLMTTFAQRPDTAPIINSVSAELSAAPVPGTPATVLPVIETAPRAALPPLPPAGGDRVAPTVAAPAPQPNVALASTAMKSDLFGQPASLPPSPDAQVARQVAALLPTPPAADIAGIETLSASAGLNVIVHLPRSISANRLGPIQSGLAAQGFVVDDPKFFDFTVRSTQVRYFHDSDREDAVALAKSIGAKVRDFTDFNPRPAESIVELWVAGGATTRSFVAAQRTEKPVNSFRRDIRQLGSNIQNALRSISR